MTDKQKTTTLLVNYDIEGEPPTMSYLGEIVMIDDRQKFSDGLTKLMSECDLNYAEFCHILSTFMAKVGNNELGVRPKEDRLQ